MDNFKQVVAKVIAAVAQEPGTLMYEWTLRPDQKTFDVVELYKNSDAVVAHIKHVLGELRKGAWGKSKRDKLSGPHSLRTAAVLYQRDVPRHGYRAAQFEDAFARFLPPEPNIRTLKRGGGEKT